jgi:Holliday junction resolvase RusA-like endonuclease
MDAPFNKIIKQVFLPILPTPAMRINVSGGKGQGAWVIHQTDEYLKEYDQKRFDETGIRGSNLRKKRQYEKYIAFKDEVYYWSVKNNFILPYKNFSVVFKIPIGKSIRKAERMRRLGQEHDKRPDADNLMKGLVDSFLDRKGFTKFGYDDAKTNSFFVKKVWCEIDDEGILITEYNKIDLPI